MEEAKNRRKRDHYKLSDNRRKRRMGNYYQPEIETMPVEKLQALQSERLVEQVKYVYDLFFFYSSPLPSANAL